VGEKSTVNPRVDCDPFGDPFSGLNTAFRGLGWPAVAMHVLNLRSFADSISPALTIFYNQWHTGQSRAPRGRVPHFRSSLDPFSQMSSPATVR